MIAGFETPTAGSIRIDGRDVTHLRANRRAIGMVFQAYALFPNMTVEGNIGFGLKVAGKPAAAIEARVDGDARPDQAAGPRRPLSASAVRRPAAARVARPRARAEPADPAARRAALGARRAHPRRAYARRFARCSASSASPRSSSPTTRRKRCRSPTAIVVMNEGAIEQVGSPAEIYNRPRTRFVASFVGTLNMLEGVVVDPAAGAIRVGGATICRARADRRREGGRHADARAATRGAPARPAGRRRQRACAS